MPKRPKKGIHSRAHNRRVKEGFYEKYIVGDGIDIGCTNRDRSITPEVQFWDLNTRPGGAATHMRGVEDNKYDYVLASHILEHLFDVRTALRNWFRILKPGGYLIICVPERDIFERKKTLPSKMNIDHKWYFKIEESEPPVTLSLKKLLQEELPPGCIKIEYIKVCAGWNPEAPSTYPPEGEFQIEAVIKKIHSEAR